MAVRRPLGGAAWAVDPGDHHARRQLELTRPAHRRVLAAALLGVALAACGGDRAGAPGAAAHSTRAVPGGAVVWLRAGADGAGGARLRRNARLLAVVHPTSFHPASLDRIDADPGLRAASAAVRAANPRALVVPAVVDDELSTNPRAVAAMHRMLLDHQGAAPGPLMERHVSTLARLAEPYDGLAVDYEFTFDSLRGDATAMRNGFTTFIQALRRALPRDKVLAVAVRARTSAPPSPAQAVYDYRAIGRAADLVEVLAYDHAWPTSEPGEIAPRPWVASVARYTRRQLDHTGARPVLLIGNYGYDWPVDGAGRRTVPGTALTATALRRLPGFSARVTHWSYTRAGQTHRVYQITTAAMRREVRGVAAPLGLRAGFWSAAESDPAAWAKIAAALR
jgi:hypothetical protein